MEERNDQNLENQEMEATPKNASNEAKLKKPIPKIAIIIGAAAVAVIAIVIVLIIAFGGRSHTHTMTGWQIEKDATCTEDGTEINRCQECDYYVSRRILYKGHVFGEWTTTVSATCTQDGIKERACVCGEKETQTIAASHNFASGICMTCNYGWVTINLPETPLNIISNLATFEITNVRYQLGRYDAGYTVRVFYSGTQTYCYKDHVQNSILNYKLVDSDGYVVFSSYVLTPDMNVGDKVKDKSFAFQYVDLDPNETYTLVLSGSGII